MWLKVMVLFLVSGYTMYMCIRHVHYVQLGAQKESNRKNLRNLKNLYQNTIIVVSETDLLIYVAQSHIMHLGTLCTSYSGN